MRRTWIGLLFVALTPVAAAGELSRYVDERCKYEFRYPSDWQVVAIPDHLPQTCSVRIEPKDLAERLASHHLEDGFTLTLSAFQGDFLQAAAFAGFNFYRGEWAVVGRQGLRDGATVIKGGTWSGVKGTATIGCLLAKRPGQPGVGLCDEYRAALQDDYEHVWTLTGEAAGTGEVFKVVLDSFKWSGEQP